MLEPRHPSLKVVSFKLRLEVDVSTCCVVSETLGDRPSKAQGLVTRIAREQLAGATSTPARSSTRVVHVEVWMCANDPSAGSPTETLLRLLLPLSDKVH